MKDLITKGTGNSRYLRSVADFLARFPTYESFAVAFSAGLLPVDFAGLNPDGILQMGTPHSTVNMLTEETAKALGLTAEDPVINDALAKIASDLKSTVPLTRGGTGQTSAAKSLYALINGATALAATGLAAGDYIGVGDVSATTGKKVTLHDLAAYLVPAGGGAKIETGSYLGTGTGGKDNPQSITFSFAPKLVFMLGDIAPNGGKELFLVDDSYRAGSLTHLTYFAMAADLLTTEFEIGTGFLFQGNGSTYGKKSEDGKTFYWYYTGSSSAAAEFNVQGYTYHWLAIG